MQAQIEQAIKVTRSNRAAAEYLRVGYNLYKRFAKMYKNKEGVTLFDIHKNQEGKGINKTHGYDKNRHKLDDILLGKHPTYPTNKLMSRLFISSYVEERCVCCNFSSKRPSDLKTPLILNHINGNKTDHRLENLEVLCYNCYFINVGNLTKRQMDNVLLNERPESQLPTEEDIIANADQITHFDLLSEEEKMGILKQLEDL
jgi:hypothetical protein